MAEQPTPEHPDEVAKLVGEVKRLRTRNAELTAALGRIHPTTRGARRAKWRSVAAAALGTIGVLLLLAAVPVVWLRGQVLDTDRYVATVAPLGRDPTVQDEIARKAADAISQRLDVADLARDNLPPSAKPLAAPVAAGVEQFIDQMAHRFTKSDAFVRLWDAVNRTGHEQLVAVLTGRATAGGARVDDEGRLLLDLGPVIEAVKQRLTAAGLAVVGRIPPTSLVVEVARISGVERARMAVRWLDRAGVWLPWLAAGCLLGAVAAAADRRRTTLLLALAVVGTMLALRVAVTLLRDASLDAVPAGALSPAVAATVFDQITGALRATGRVVAVLALLVAAAAFLAGPSGTAVWVRGAAVTLAGRLRGGGGASPGPVGAWIAAHRAVLRGAVMVAAALAVLFWGSLTPTVLLVVAAVAAAALFAIEVLGGRPTPAKGLAQDVR